MPKRSFVCRKSLKASGENNEFSRIYQQHGGTGLNAATGKDYTYYVVSLPSVEFELWCWLESDRLLNPVFRQFYKERQVVREERRSRVDDNPSGLVYETLLATAYLAHPNRLPIIGWPSDIEHLQIEHLRELYETYYRPDNIVLSLVGDLEVEAIKPLLEKYFGRIPAPKTPLPEIRLKEEPQEGPRNATVRFDAAPRFAMAYHKPVYPVRDDIHFLVLHSLLAEGRSSLFYKELVLDKRLASSVSTSEAPGERYPSLFYIWGVPRNGVSSEKLISEVDAIIERIKTTPFSDKEIAAAKRRYKSDVFSVLSSNEGTARYLARAELLHGNWESIFDIYDIAVSTTAEDIMTIAKKYLSPNARTVVQLVKKGEGK